MFAKTVPAAQWAICPADEFYREALEGKIKPSCIHWLKKKKEKKRKRKTNPTRKHILSLAAGKTGLSNVSKVYCKENLSVISSVSHLSNERLKETSQRITLGGGEKPRYTLPYLWQSHSHGLQDADMRLLALPPPT